MFLTKFPKWKSPTCKTFSAIIVTAASEATSLASFCWGNRVCRRVKPSQTPHRTLVFYVSLMCDAFNAAAALLCAATLVSSCLTDDFLQTSSFSPRVWKILWGKPLWKLLIQLLWLTRHRIGQQQKIYSGINDADSMLNSLDTLQIYLWHLNCDDGMFMAWLQLYAVCCPEYLLSSAHCTLINIFLNTFINV